MNIILEGSDAVYKSTVAEKLSDKLNLPVAHGSSFESATGTEEELYRFIENILNKDEQIIDRSFPSNLVYSSVYPQYTQLNPKQVKKLKNKISDNAIVVYLTASVDTIISRINARGDDQVKTDQIPEIISVYNTVIPELVKSGITVYTYDTGVLSSDDVTKQILRLPELQERSPILRCAECDIVISKQNSFFNHTHCFKCYSKIKEELFKNAQ